MKQWIPDELAHNLRRSNPAATSDERPFYWSAGGAFSLNTAPTGWYIWDAGGLHWLGETILENPE